LLQSSGESPSQGRRIPFGKWFVCADNSFENVY
jgi:hypothetical protein